MIMTITLIITSLVVLNFLLLAFSCNRTTKKQLVENKSIKRVSTFDTNQLESHQLALTGS